MRFCSFTKRIVHWVYEQLGLQFMSRKQFFHQHGISHGFISGMLRPHLVVWQLSIYVDQLSLSILKKIDEL